MKSIPLVFIIVLFFYSGLAQESENSVRLFSTFSDFSTERFRHELDTLLHEIQNNPELKGFVAIYGAKEDLQQKFLLEKTIQQHLKFREFPESKLKIIRGENNKEARIEFWLSRNDAKPNISGEVWEFTLPVKKTAFVFGKGNLEFIKHQEQTKVFIGECGIDCNKTLDLEVFSGYLLNNSRFNGHLIFYAKSKKIADRHTKLLLKILAEEYKIPANRLKTFYGGNRESNNFEVWFVPKRR